MNIYHDSKYTSDSSLSFRETASLDKPREKLERLGAKALSDKELAMLLISSGTKTITIDSIAENLLEHLGKNPDIQYPELLSIPGLGQAKASLIAGALELGRRKVTRTQRTISNPQDIYEEIRHFATRTQENLIVVILNGAHEVISTEVATIGLVNRTLVHPREVFASAIEKRAAAICLAHNHPSGRLEPSDDDKDVTDRIVKAGVILGIKVLDHLVFTENGYFSFLEHGIM